LISRANLLLPFNMAEAGDGSAERLASGDSWADLARDCAARTVADATLSASCGAPTLDHLGMSLGCAP
jgi:hypothetical protein